jgi:hypothetical protein
MEQSVLCELHLVSTSRGFCKGCKRFQGRQGKTELSCHHISPCASAVWSIVKLTSVLMKGKLFKSIARTHLRKARLQSANQNNPTSRRSFQPYMSCAIRLFISSQSSGETNKLQTLWTTSGKCSALVEKNRSSMHVPLVCISLQG